MGVVVVDQEYCSTTVSWLKQSCVFVIAPAKTCLNLIDRWTMPLSSSGSHGDRQHPSQESPVSAVATLHLLGAAKFLEVSF